MGVLATAPNRANDGDGVTVIESKGPTHHIFSVFLSSLLSALCSLLLCFDVFQDFMVCVD